MILRPPPTQGPDSGIKTAFWALMLSLQAAELPRERCLQNGPSCLSLRECLALILGSGPPKIGAMGLAAGILQRTGVELPTEEQERAFFSAMEIQGLGHLRDLPGLGPASQARILAAFELGRRYHQLSNYNPALPLSPRSALDQKALQQIDSKHRTSVQEWLGFIPLYRNGELGTLCIVEKGVRTHVNVEPAELFARILVLRPRGFFLFHNHPGGTLRASGPDLHLTQQVKTTAQQLGLEFLGHWIVAPKGHVLV